MVERAVVADALLAAGGQGWLVQHSGGIRSISRLTIAVQLRQQPHGKGGETLVL